VPKKSPRSRRSPASPAAPALPSKPLLPIKPAAMPIWPDACRYVGGISRAMFYKSVKPFVDFVEIGTRQLPTIESLDRFVEKNTAKARPADDAARDSAATGAR
jgi:hypothetical protein